MSEQITRIGRRDNSIVSTYVISDIGKEVRSISFYTKADGVIIRSDHSWLCGENKEYTDFNRLDEFQIKGGLTHHNATLNVENRMKKGGSFTVNAQKKYCFDEPCCDLYIEIDNDFVKLIDVHNYQELFVSEFSFEAKTLFFKRAIIQICTDLGNYPLCMTNTYIQEHTGSREENTKDAKENLDRMNDILRDKFHLFCLDKSGLAQLINRFNLTLKAVTVVETLTKTIKMEHPTEKYGE